MFLFDLDLSSSFITRLVQLLISVVIDTRCFLFLGVSRLIHLLSWQLFKLSLVMEPQLVTSTFRANIFSGHAGENVVCQGSNGQRNVSEK